MASRDSWCTCRLEGGPVLLRRVRMCRSYGSKFRGLLGTSHLAPDEGCWLEGASSVHMFGMRYPLDIVFLGSDSTILRIVPDLAPWKVSPWVPRSRSVLEIMAGRAAAFDWRPGMKLVFETCARGQA